MCSLQITDYIRDGSISISLTASDGRPFCIGIRVIQRLTMDQVDIILIFLAFMDKSTMHKIDILCE
jgi:hypothetical protein